MEMGFTFVATETDVFAVTSTVKSFDVSSIRRVSSGISLDERPQNNMETIRARLNRWWVWRAEFISICLYIEHSANSTLENRPQPLSLCRLRLFFSQNQI